MHSVFAINSAHPTHISLHRQGTDTAPTPRHADHTPCEARPTCCGCKQSIHPVYGVPICLILCWAQKGKAQPQVSAWNTRRRLLRCIYIFPVISVLQYSTLKCCKCSGRARNISSVYRNVLYYTSIVKLKLSVACVRRSKSYKIRVN